MAHRVRQTAGRAPLDEGIQDYRAASSEIHSNLDVRRLMFVVMHILLPGGVMAACDAITGTHYTAELLWWPRHVVLLLGVILALVGTVVCVILMRCHLGMVINSGKMRCVLHGDAPKESLNLRGITTSFVGLTAFSSGAGLVLVVLHLAPWIVAVLSGLVYLGVMLGLFYHQHGRANRKVSELRSAWRMAEVPLEWREKHSTDSLDATNADVAVIVTMATALFTGFFTAMTKVGAIPQELEIGLDADAIRNYGVTVGAAYLVLSLGLSARMILRLREAVAEHSLSLAQMREEADDPWSFRPFERTFLLFLVVMLFCASSVTILLWPGVGGAWASISGALLTGLAMARYILFVKMGKRRVERRLADSKKAGDEQPQEPQADAEEHDGHGSA